MIRSVRSAVRYLRFGIAALALAAGQGPAIAQPGVQAPAPGVPRDGLLGDQFAEESGAIIVSAQRQPRGNLFEDVPIPPESCLASAPELGAGTPGFTIDGSGMRRVRDLERIRKSTKAGTIFVSGGTFVGQDFRKARLDNICFFNADFSQTDWTGFAGTGLGFINVDLTGANMASTRLPYVLLRDTRLRLVDGRSASWPNGQIDGGWTGSLSALDLTGADLTGFRIVCGTSAQDGCPTDRDGMSLAGANLRRASFHSFYWPDINLNGARIDQTELGLDHLRALDGALLVGPVVLRSPRRAIMLFPGEVQQLAEVAQRGDDAMGVCQGVLEPAEALICAAPGSAVRTLIESVADLTARSGGTPAAANSARVNSARVWGASREACMTLPAEDARLACVIEAYRAHDAALRSEAGTPAWIGTPGYRLFLSSEAAYPTARCSPGLYGKILPILLDSAIAAVIVRIADQGVIAAKGQALGGCSFGAGKLQFDAASASLNVVTRPRTRRLPPEVYPLVVLAGRSARVVEQGLARFPGCTVDSGFPRLEEITLDETLLAVIWERF